MKKENLVLIHSFPTNSVLLSGLIDYLSDYFNVYFIDLPGFTKAVPPLKRISYEGYYDYVEKKIDEFHLDDYLAGGISFGFAIINHLKHGKKCKGIIAIEPFIGLKSLKFSTSKRILYSFLIQTICTLRLYSLFWGSPLAAKYLPKLRGYPPETMMIMFEQIDGRTFFETANILLKDRNEYRFHDLPYVFVGNKNDRTVNYNYIYETLSRNVTKLLVLNTEIDHYPRDTSKAYFKRMVPKEIFEKMTAFFAEQSPVSTT
jgi:pimeloyl-ACP methyl ester carboxylesterase